MSPLRHILLSPMSNFSKKIDFRAKSLLKQCLRDNLVPNQQRLAFLITEGQATFLTHFLIPYPLLHPLGVLEMPNLN